MGRSRAHSIDIVRVKQRALKFLCPVSRSIVNRFCKDHFASSYKQTIGLDFFMKHIQLPGETQCAPFCSLFGRLVRATNPLTLLLQVEPM